MKLETMSVSNALDLGLKILLEEGFIPGEYSKVKNWKEGIEYCYGLDWEAERYESCNLSEIAEVWGLIFIEEYVDISKSYTQDGITVEVAGTEYDSKFTNREAYFVVLKLTQGDITRYIKQQGWYSSYGQSSLSEGEAYEVMPHSVTVLEWTSK